MNEFLQMILEWDRSLFLLINSDLAYQFADSLVITITRKQTWYLPGAILLIWLVWRGGSAGRITALLMILGVVLADQISSSLLKPLLQRMRPCKALEGVRLLVHCGSWYGFPSSHAANAAVVATIGLLYRRNSASFWIIFAFLVGMSRVYLGVHYPGDVLCGWLLGIAIGWLLMKLAFPRLAKTAWFSGAGRSVAGEGNTGIS